MFEYSNLAQEDGTKKEGEAKNIQLSCFTCFHRDMLMVVDE